MVDYNIFLHKHNTISYVLVQQEVHVPMHQMANKQLISLKQSSYLFWNPWVTSGNNI